MQYNDAPRPLTPAEFDEMMRACDEAGDWMRNQVKLRRAESGLTATPDSELRINVLEPHKCLDS